MSECTNSLCLSLSEHPVMQEIQQFLQVNEDMNLKTAVVM